MFISDSIIFNNIHRGIKLFMRDSKGQDRIEDIHDRIKRQKKTEQEMSGQTGQERQP